MSKVALLVGIPVALAAAWAGGTWFVGKQTETVLRDQIAKANKMMASQGVREELVTFNQGFLNSDAVVSVSAKGSPFEELLKDLRFNAQIKNGPVLFGDGSPSVGLSRWTITLDQESLKNPEAKEFIKTAFLGKEPFVAVSDIGFGNSAKTDIIINPIKIEKDGTTVEFAGATGSGTGQSDAMTGKVDLKLGAFSVKGATEPTISIPATTMAVNVTGLIGNIMLGDMQLKSDKISITPQGATEPISFDIALDSTSQSKDQLLDGVFNLKALNIKGVQDQFSNINYGMKYSGFSVAGAEELGKIQQELQSLQSQLAFNNPNMDTPEGQKKMTELFGQMQALTGKMFDAIFGKLLQADKSRLVQNLAVDSPKGKSALDMDLLYHGAAKAPTVDDIMMGTYTPEQWADLVRGTIKVDADKAMLPPMVPMLAGDYVTQGLIKENDKQYQVALKLDGKTVDLNGTSMPFMEFVGKLIPAGMGAGGADLGAGAPDEGGDLAASMGAASASDFEASGIPPELAKEAAEKGLTPELLKKLAADPKVKPEMLDLLRQMEQMQSGMQAPQEGSAPDQPAKAQ